MGRKSTSFQEEYEERILESYGVHNLKGDVNILGIVFTEREVNLMLNCVNYAEGGPAGLPGHNLMLIIAKFYHAVGVPSHVEESYKNRLVDGWE